MVVYKRYTFVCGKWTSAGSETNSLRIIYDRFTPCSVGVASIPLSSNFFNRWGRTLSAVVSVRARRRVLFVSALCLCALRPTRLYESTQSRCDTGSGPLPCRLARQKRRTRRGAPLTIEQFLTVNATCSANKAIVQRHSMQRCACSFFSFTLRNT